RSPNGSRPCASRPDRTPTPDPSSNTGSPGSSTSTSPGGLSSPPTPCSPSRSSPAGTCGRPAHAAADGLAHRPKVQTSLFFCSFLLAHARTCPTFQMPTTSARPLHHPSRNRKHGEESSKEGDQEARREEGRCQEGGRSEGDQGNADQVRPDLAHRRKHRRCHQGRAR